jgi:hypothetical protein
MPISKRQLAANRRNAQKSTGPRSEAGKEKASRNHLTHGLCGQFTVLSCESQAKYDDLFERFLAIEQPADDIERELVAKMARHTWLSERAVRCQEGCFLVQPRSQEDIEKELGGIAVRTDLEVYVRYQAAHDRAYARAASELAKRRAARQKTQNGFEQQKRAQAEEIRKAEFHPHKVAAAAARAEREQAAATVASIKAADKITSFLPPGAAGMAAPGNKMPSFLPETARRAA